MIMRKSIFLLLIVSVLVSFASAFGQVKEIERDEYYKAFREASAKSRTVSRRNVQSITGLRNDNPFSEEWTYEYQLPDRVRYLHVITFGGITRRVEQIDIADVKYCRRDDGEWALSKSYCIGGSAFGGPSGVISERFERENIIHGGQDLIRFGQYITYKNSFSETAASDGPSFWKSTFWVDRSGRLVRSEASRGLVTGPKVSYESKERIEYDRNIKIEAPIK